MQYPILRKRLKLPHSLRQVEELTINIKDLKKALIWKPESTNFWKVSLFLKYGIADSCQFENEAEDFKTQKEAIKFVKEDLKIEYYIQRERSLKNLRKKWGLN